MHALVYYVVKFVFVTLRVGALVRGPDDHRDIHLDPVSHPNAKEAGLMDVESSGRWSTVPAARKLGANVFPFPISQQKFDDRRKINGHQESRRGTAKLSGLGVLSLWLVVWCLLINM